ncbi:hypothetical protein DFS34DRAFT_226989 [Phlyctochytrium arcticum]|nr:hypothetical protein DFS34DRAFT_226989 [Phlyctochytrium arcticum]
MPSEVDRLSSLTVDQFRLYMDIKSGLDEAMAENRWWVIQLKVWATLFMVLMPLASAIFIMAGAKEPTVIMMAVVGLAIFATVAVFCHFGKGR